MPTVNMIEYLDRISYHKIYVQGYVVQQVVQTTLSQYVISLELPEQSDPVDSNSSYQRLHRDYVVCSRSPMI